MDLSGANYNIPYLTLSPVNTSNPNIRGQLCERNSRLWERHNNRSLSYWVTSSPDLEEYTPRTRNPTPYYRNPGDKYVGIDGVPWHARRSMALTGSSAVVEGMTGQQYGV